MKNTFTKNNWVFMINSINYVSFKAVYSYTIIKCNITMLKCHHLAMHGYTSTYERIVYFKFQF